jgi:hypothetical protein
MAETSWPLEGGYRIDVFSEQTAVDAERVIELWTTEGALPAQEAQRRLGEILLVAVGPRAELAGISTAYLKRSEQLRDDLWHVRMMVAGEHRRSAIALYFARLGLEHLVQRYVSGEDRRGIGVIYEVENEALKRPGPGGLSRYNARARWPGVDFTFIGESANGAHVRVHYFPGAHAPESDQLGST